MKKSLLLTVVMALWAASGFAFIGGVNLVSNGDFSADNFNAYDKAESCVINDIDYHTAPYSCEQTGGTKDIAQQVMVTGGKYYKISFWYKVKTEGDGKDARIWSYIAGGDMTSEVTAKLKGPDNGYLPNVSVWTKYETVVLAQPEATLLNLELRTYSGAVVLWDDLSVVEEVVDPADAKPIIMDVKPESGSNYKEGEQFEVSAIVTTTDPAGIDTVMLATGETENALTDTMAMPGADGNYSTPVMIDEAGTYYGQIIAIGKNGKVKTGSSIEVNIEEVVTYPVIDLVKDDYKIILDSVNARQMNTSSKTDESEDYYGASYRFSNFSVGDGKYNAKFATADAAIKEALATIILPVKMDTAEVGDTVKVKYAMYGGSSNAGEMTFVCLQEDPLVFLFPGEQLPGNDSIAPMWADGYPSVDMLTADGFTLKFKASEVATAYGIMSDTMPTVALTKEQVKALALVGDNGGLMPVGTTETSTELTDMTSEHTYYLYTYLEDAAGNESDSVSVLMITTLEGDGKEVFAGEDFQGLDDGVYARPGFKNEVLSGSSTGWEVKSYDGESYASFSSYKGTGEDSVRMVSPVIDLTVATENSFTFDVNTGYYNAACLKVLLSTDYNGVDAGAATWVNVTDSFTLPVENTSGYGDFVNAGSISLESYGDKVAIAFEYVGNGGDSRTTTFQLDNIVISGKMKEYTMVTGFEALDLITVDSDLHILSFGDIVNSSLLPDSVVATVDGQSMKLAIGEWMPIKGKVVDLQAKDTIAAYVVLPAGYKYDGMAMVEQVIDFTVTQTLVVMDKLSIDFAADLGGCKVVQVQGQTGWYLDSYGYAKVNTFGNGANESWLVTPPVNIDGLTSPIFKFDVASYNSDKKISACGAEQFEVYYSATAKPGIIKLSDWTRFTAVDDVTLGDRWAFSTADVDLTGVSGTAVFFAFRHKSDDSNGTTWEVDNIVVDEKPSSLRAVNALSLEVYPNPATTAIYLTKAVETVEVINLAGKTMLMTSAVEANSSVDVSALSAGIYMVKVTVEGQSAMTKLIKK